MKYYRCKHGRTIRVTEGVMSVVDQGKPEDQSVKIAVGPNFGTFSVLCQHCLLESLVNNRSIVEISRDSAERDQKIEVTAHQVMSALCKSSDKLLGDPVFMAKFFKELGFKE